ncbi:prion-inhibition and propagation-domain-containing protein [Diplogelasinospora grovesii]|uniref:Prion-inhibition and propagation-domain-containing protein n=1 Tax=Diplogelasinospora grovesii TaxID=303347 RepID=A0AAN6NB93_9PEZI|nr:prion-inhibition and propagation-domain-containing protein [Diplogelasinospora grovesii]
MEVGGFVVGVVGLASLFNNVIDCFEYIHIGKSLGSNLQVHLLRLDNARLRLSRWGDALGLSGGAIDDTTALPSNVWSEADKRKAEDNLGQILEQFNKAWKISAQYKIRKESDGDEGSLDLATLSLHEKMRELSKKRQNRATLAKKMKFALYDEKHLRTLVDDITNLTNELVDLFPAQKPKQSELAAREVAEFTEPLRVLSTATTGQDELLASALAQILKPADNLMNFYTEKSNVMKMGTDTGGRYEMKVGSPW